MARVEIWVGGVPKSGCTVIRWAVSSDAQALARLAVRDSSSVPEGKMLIAEVSGEIWAALSSDSGRSIADPLRPCGALVGLLSQRLGQLTVDETTPTCGAPRRPSGYARCRSPVVLP